LPDLDHRSASSPGAATSTETRTPHLRGPGRARPTFRIVPVVEALMDRRGEDVDAVMDRYFSPTYRARVDGVLTDRASFAERVRGIRSMLADTGSVTVTLEDEVADGAAYASRYVLEVSTPERSAVREVYLFGRLADDGRLELVDEVTLELETARP
jgi:hypothetical protein